MPVPQSEPLLALVPTRVDVTIAKKTCNSSEVVMIKKSLKRGCRCGVGQKSKGVGEPNASHKS